VNSRFGAVGRHVHELASGVAGRPLADHVRAESLEVELGLDTPTTRSDTLGFLARQLGAELLTKVRRQGLVCTQITIELDAAAGQSSSRTWRIEDMQENAIADRLRWQAEGWLAGAAVAAHAGAGPKAGGRPDGEDPHLRDLVHEPTPDVEHFSADGIIALRLIAAELTTPIGATRGLFEENTGQITHTLERLQGLFGPHAVLVPGIQGGWDPAETNLWTPWQQTAVPERSPAAPRTGALHAPRPPTVEHAAADALAADGPPVEARPSGLQAAPATIRFPTGQTEATTDSSGSWPIESRWWDPERAVYRTRLQVVTDSGRALL